MGNDSNPRVKSSYFVIERLHANVDMPTMLDSKSADVSFEQKELIEGLFLGETGHFAVEIEPEPYIRRW